MNSRKTAAIVAMVLIGTQAMANEKATPFDKVMTYTSILPTALTTLPAIQRTIRRNHSNQRRPMRLHSLVQMAKYAARSLSRRLGTTALLTARP